MKERELKKNNGLDAGLRALHDIFTVTGPQMLDIAEKFYEAMLAGLAGQKGPLKMLPSFLSVPTGKECGVFLSVDFGGTNVRVSLIELRGNGRITVIKKISTPLKEPGRYDYTSSAATGRELFGFLAEQIAGLVRPGENIPLGHTFSFPTEMRSLNQAVLIGWTKEFKTGMTEGRDITLLLREALQRQGLHGIRPVAVINDTVGTLLAAAYGDPHADIGSICGTGHNTCYLEPRPPHHNGPVIINIESGNFDMLPLNDFDRQLDRHSEKPGEQVLEKMVSGRYLGELMRLAVLDLVQKGCLFQKNSGNITGFPFKNNSLGAEHMSLMLGDGSDGLTGTAAWLKEHAGMRDPLPVELSALKTIASLLTTRAARLAAATYAGVLRRLDPFLKLPHTIAVDGSLYEKTPGFASHLRLALDEILRERAGQVTVKPAKDGSGMGAAIAAAIAAASEEML
ncbi:hexokinase [Pelotomaculum propionicicum]|uniref:hexokinase n=1 Tax=Pelotomaculum propionicicum TaxID=258475 RepID=UPI003B791AD3